MQDTVMIGVFGCMFICYRVILGSSEPSVEVSVDYLDLVNVNDKSSATFHFPTCLFHLQTWFNIYPNVHCPLPMKEAVWSNILRFC